MTDGHTEAGSYEVVLKLTGDQVQQLTRLLDMAKMMNGRNIDTGQRPETFDVIAYRAFLEELLVLLRDADIKQKPVDKKPKKRPKALS